MKIMKILISIIFTILITSIFSQTSPEYIRELEILRAEQRKEEQSVDSHLPSQQRAALLSQILAKYQGKEGELSVKYNKIEAQSRNQQEYDESVKRNSETQKRNDQRNQQAKNYQAELDRQNQASSQASNQVQRFSNSMSNASTAMRNAMIISEMNRRNKVALKFINSNSSDLTSIIEAHKRIPQENFNKLISGSYIAQLVSNKQFSFLNNQSTESVVECIVIVENNLVSKVYPFKKQNFEISFIEPIELINGISSFYDETSKVETMLILTSPFLNQNATQSEIIKSETAEISIWSKKKKLEGQNIYIQELDKNGFIIREIKTQIIYAKNKTEISSNQQSKITINTGNKMLVFCEPTTLSIGYMSPYAAPSKLSSMKSDTYKAIKIKRYIF
jgi:hypothetical protein